MVRVPVGANMQLPYILRFGLRSGPTMQSTVPWPSPRSHPISFSRICLVFRGRDRIRDRRRNRIKMGIGIGIGIEVEVEVEIEIEIWKT